MDKARTTAAANAAALPLVPARMVNEVLYCERLMYLEWVQGEWADNHFTADGTRVHKRVDRKQKPLNQQSRTGEVAAPYQARSVWLSSERLGVTAKLDLVDVDSKTAIAVEYKRGKKPSVPEGAYLPERAQLCVHVLLLREHGYVCNEAEIYFAGDRRRTTIAIDEPLIETTLTAIARARELALQGKLPPPLNNSPKCVHCSLNSICLPDETNRLRAKRLPLRDLTEDPEPPGQDGVGRGSDLSIDLGGAGVQAAENDPGTREVAGAEDELEGRDATRFTQEEGVEAGALTEVAVPLAKAPSEPRRLLPTRDDKQPVYVATQGAKLRLDGHQLLVYANGEKQDEARLPQTSQVSLFGNVQISTQAIRELLKRGIGLHFFSYGGWWCGSCVGVDSNNVELRLAQYRASQDPETALRFARRWVHAKIANCRTLLRRNHRNVDPVVLKELKFLARKVLQADSLASLLGFEGTAARTYFGAFSGMLSQASLCAGYDFDGRSRRPPRDRLNALLSFAYALLTKDVHTACRVVGLDPTLGFYHQPHFGRPSLALDLMEEFRPLIGDSVVLHAVNNGVIDPGDFQEAVGSFALKEHARKRMIQTYEQRLQQEVTHPVFGYRISYRRVLEVQARLLSRVLLGELNEYPSFRTR